VSVDRKGKGKAGCGQADVGGETAGVGAASMGLGMGGCNWAWEEKAMYQDINLGFHFGLDRRHSFN
jgi:hypothetical protein